MAEAGFLGSSQLEICLLLALMASSILLGSRTRCARMSMLRLSGKSKSIEIAVTSILLCLLLALAVLRPYWGKSETEVRTQGTDIMALVDVSLSMMADDSPPFRLAFAKRKLLDLVSLLSHRVRGDRLGLVLFSGESYLFCPPTSDYGMLQTYINAISTDLIASGGSSILEGVSIAVKSLESSQALASAAIEHPTLLLLSDGEDLEFDASAILRILAQAKVPLSAIGIGSSDGRPIPLVGGQFVRDRKGTIVLSRLREDNLTRVSENSGGVYRHASLDDTDLEAVLNSTRLRASSAERAERIINYRELGPYVAIAALALICVCFMFGRQALLFPMVVMAITWAGADWANAQDAPPSSSLSGRSLKDSFDSNSSLSPYEAYRAYDQGDYEGAFRGFESAVNSDPNDLKSLQGLGNSLFRLERYDEARTVFDKLQAHAESGRQKFEGLFNRGNAELQLKDAKQAIQSYEQALAIKPGDEAAEHNLSIAKKMLEMAPPTPSPQPSSSSSNQDSSSSSASSTTSSDSARSESSQSSTGSGSGENKSSGVSSFDKSASTGGSSGSDGASSDESSSPASAAQEREASSGRGQASSPSQQDNQSAAPPDKSRGDSSQDLPRHDPKALKEEEAKSWLDSLSDSPPLVYKKGRSQRRTGEQYW